MCVCWIIFHIYIYIIPKLISPYYFGVRGHKMKYGSCDSYFVSIY